MNFYNKTGRRAPFREKLKPQPKRVFTAEDLARAVVYAIKPHRKGRGRRG